MRRLDYLDSLKGIAIIFVVIGHVSNGYLNQGVSNELFVHSHNLATSFHMPLFFAISGYLFHHAYFNDAEELRKEKLKIQMINLVLIYLIYSVLLWTFKYLLRAYVTTQLTIKNLLLIPIKPFELYWYLFVLILFYFVFSMRPVIRIPNSVLLLSTMLISVCSFWIPETWYFGIKNFMFYIVYFCLGVILSREPELLNHKKHICLLFPVVITFYIVFWNTGDSFKNIPGVNIAIGCGMIICLFFSFKEISCIGENRFLSYIGRNSLVIYLFHTYFVTFCRTLFKLLHLSNPLIIVIVSTILGVLLPIMISLVCNKIRISDCLFSPYKCLCHKRKKLGN